MSGAHAHDWLDGGDGESSINETDTTRKEKETSPVKSSSSPSSSSSSESEDDLDNDLNFAKADKASAVVPSEMQPTSKNFFLLNPKNFELILFLVTSSESVMVTASQ